MRLRPHSLVALAAGVVLGLLPLTLASADDSANTSDAKTSSTSSKAVKARSKVEKSQTKRNKTFRKRTSWTRCVMALWRSTPKDGLTAG